MTSARKKTSVRDLYKPNLISEAAFAKILGVSRTILTKWRLNGRKDDTFPFSIIRTCNRFLYDENEAYLYIRNKIKKGKITP